MKRPINLNIFTIQFPITAYVSILHRISGIFLLLLIPILLSALQQSLHSEIEWNNLQTLFRMGWVKGVLWVMLAGLTYHFVAGIRHLLMDMHIGESKAGGRISSYVVFTIFSLIVLALGYGLWL